jgi:hypothetical protein
MNGEEYRQIRKSLKLSQAALAKEAGVHLLTIHKREVSSRDVGYEAEFFIKALADKMSAVI